jgi:excisionase family DNA binding protein
MDTGRFLTATEAAAILRCSPRTIRSAITAGRLPSVRLGPRLVRIPEAGLAAWQASWTAGYNPAVERAIATPPAETRSAPSVQMLDGPPAGLRGLVT